MFTTVLFDLNGTLLPMDQDIFTVAYFSNGYQSETLIIRIWTGTAVMVKNDGYRTKNKGWNSVENKLRFQRGGADLLCRL